MTITTRSSSADNNSPCPCQSGHHYQDCCQPLHQGTAASSPAALMRSRYSAYVLSLNDYLATSWHSETRPTHITPDNHSQWKALNIISEQEDADRGLVHFRATWFDQGNWGVLEEKSLFLKEQGHWRYHSGEVQQHKLNIGRNDLCPCKSGLKYKKCCA